MINRRMGIAGSLLATLFILGGCASEGADQTDVNEIQAEMRSQVPKDQDKVPADKATAGLNMAGPKGGR